MASRVHTVAFEGVDVVDVDVQVQFSPGIVAFTIVGLPDKAVGESRERIRSSLHAMGLALPAKRITVNLSPADLQKEGSHYDLPIALGLLHQMKLLPDDALLGFIALGELALDSSITSVPGVLPAALHALGLEKGLICPYTNGGEAAWAPDSLILAPRNLIALLNHFKGSQILPRPDKVVQHKEEHARLHLSDVKGQEVAKRALIIAAAGGHNLLMVGPPGSGKSMLAERLPTLLPELEPEEALELTMLYSVAGKLKESQLLKYRPYRSPHHSASLPALVGGGYKALPGEISLAHAGVLFLDELPEFSRSALEALRQPLEAHKVTIARVNAHVTYPARFQLVAAMNPCPCGYAEDARHPCAKRPQCALSYQSRISGPVRDRFDLEVGVYAVPIHALKSVPKGKLKDESIIDVHEESCRLKASIKEAQSIQRQRYQRALTSSIEPSKGRRLRNFLAKSGHLNATVESSLFESLAFADPDALRFFETAAEKLHLSARSYYRSYRVARTIADLAGSKTIQNSHFAEALMLRSSTKRE
jgi:magnesium chelatase family protein